MFSLRVLLPLLLPLALLAGCGDDGGAVTVDARAATADAASSVDAASATTDAANVDAGSTADAANVDAGSTADAAIADAGATADASIADAGSTEDADVGVDAGLDAGARITLIPGFCPSSPTAPGLYAGTLGSNFNDLSGITGCGSLSAAGRDGAVRIELEVGQTVTAVYRHDGDGILYILDSCPVTTSCLDGSDNSLSGAETVTYTNTGGATNPIYVVLDSDSLAAPQTFELDLTVTGP